MTQVNVVTRPTEELSGLLYDVCMAVRQKPYSERENPFGYATFEALEALSLLRDGDPIIDNYCKRMGAVLNAALDESLTNEQIADFKNCYDAAQVYAYPTVTEFLKHCHKMVGLTRNHSLSCINLTRLRRMEHEGYADASLKKSIDNFRNRLEKTTSVSDVKGYSQAFEIYSETVIYMLLKDRFPLTEKIDEKNGKTGSTPDFKCEWKGKVFYVEVKSFDVVHGESRHHEMMDDGLNANIDLESQVLANKKIATAITEIAPYRKSGKDADYDPRSLIRVINTLIDKSHSAFKTSQFKMGPTFAVAVCDRLLMPGRRFSLAPYYYDDFQGGAVISGVLWHMCFGQTGTPIFRHPDFEGQPSLEGYMTKSGIYNDVDKVFPGLGFIAIELKESEQEIFGLFDGEYEVNSEWPVDDVKEILSILCTAYNDKANSHAFELSSYKP